MHNREGIHIEHEVHSNHGVIIFHGNGQKVDLTCPCALRSYTFRESPWTGISLVITALSHLLPHSIGKPIHPASSTNKLGVAPYRDLY